MSPVPALVSDVHLRAAVAAVRALGAAGVEVLVHAAQRSAAGIWSRHADDRLIGPDPGADPDGFVACILATAAGHGALTVLPGSEAALDALTPMLDAPPAGILLPFGDRAALAQLRDKGRLAALARGAGLSAPHVLAEATAGQPPPEVTLPCLAKPPVAGSPPGHSLILRSRFELAALLDRLPAGSPLLMQERLEGPLVSLVLVIDRQGRVVERLQSVASRTFPAGAGPSAAAVSVAPDEALVARAAGMLAECGFFGLVQLQFLASQRGLVIIDANPRCYGSLPLALACGVNLPAAWHGLATGEHRGGPKRQDAPSTYRIGVRYRWLEADLVATLQGHPGRLLRPASGPPVGAMWQPNDPIASVVLAASAAAGYLRRATWRWSPRTGTGDAAITGAAGSPITLTRLGSDEMEAVGCHWRTVEQSLAAQPPLTCSWDWTETWLRHYGDLVAPEFVLAHRDGVPCGAALISHGPGNRPRGVRCLRLGTAGEPQRVGHVFVEYNRLLCLPAVRGEFTHALVEAIRADRTWDEFALDGFAPDDAAPLLHGVPEFAVRREPSPIADLAPAREHPQGILGTLSAGVRNRVARSLRGFGPVQIDWAQTVPDAMGILDELIVLHRARWSRAGEPGAFIGRAPDFHRDLIERLLPLGRVILFRARSQTGTIGCVYNLVDGGRVLQYQGGFQRFADNKLRAGLVTHVLCMDECARRGFSEYDFMAGEQRYKRELSTGERTLVWATARRRRLRPLLPRAVGQIGAAVNHLRRAAAAR